MRSFHKYLVVALFSSFSASALAHRPPALVEQQRAAEHAVRGSGGYRDIDARFGSVPELAPRVMRQSEGYRGIAERFVTTTTPVLVMSRSAAGDS